MIVRTLDDGSLLMVNQTDHAKLAGYLAAHWGNAEFATPAPRESMVRAANCHDNGWLLYETGPRYDGVAKTSPTYFQVPTDQVQLGAFRQAIDWLSAIDPYAGLIINRHRTGLYRSRYGAVQQPAGVTRDLRDPPLDAFIAAYERRVEAGLDGLDRAAFLVNYQLLQFWDLLSLSLCMREPREEVLEAVPTGYDGDGKTGVRMVMTPLDDIRIKLRPFPFDRDELPLGYVYRQLPTAVFPDEAAFRMAYWGAPARLRSFTFVRG